MVTKERRFIIRQPVAKKIAVNLIDLPEQNEISLVGSVGSHARVNTSNENKLSYRWRERAS
jgi:hypothetical protein